MKPRLYWIATPPAKLAVMPRPQGGEDLLDDLRALRRDGVEMLVNLLAADELQELGLAAESEACDAAGIIHVPMPIADRSVPADCRPFRAVVQRIATAIEAGTSVAIHCRAGIGRSSLLAACVLNALNGCPPDAAFRIIAKSRGCSVPDTEEQRKWVTDFCENA